MRQCHCPNHFEASDSSGTAPRIFAWWRQSSLKAGQYIPPAKTLYQIQSGEISTAEMERATTTWWTFDTPDEGALTSVE